jgi:outer membrane PBP1 activator LpoA protein
MRCGVLHRLPVVTLAAAILYGGGYALASEAVSTAAPPPPALEAPVPLAPDTPLPAGAKVSPEGSVPARSPAEPEVPHIALLLPLDSPPFMRHAEAVRDGFLAAAKVQGSAPLPLRIYAVSENERAVVEGYRRALTNGARLVVGPLTRGGVTAVAESALVMVPTLALNVPDRGVGHTRDLYVLSLHAEAEARQVAQFARGEGRQSALVVHADGALYRRIHQGFVEEFTRLGGGIIAEHRFSGDQPDLVRLRQLATASGADMVFLALDYSRARVARAYLGALTAYATSHVHPGAVGPLAGFDLANVRFLDMPWMVQPEHPAVMTYPRQDHRDADLDRFYALGIDAFRVAQELLAGKTGFTLDGVIGRLRLGPDHQFARTLTGAEFDGGKLKVSGEGRDTR